MLATSVASLSLQSQVAPAPCGRGALTVCGRLLLGGAMPTVFSACAAQCSAGSTSIPRQQKDGRGVKHTERLTSAHLILTYLLPPDLTEFASGGRV